MIKKNPKHANQVLYELFVQVEDALFDVEDITFEEFFANEQDLHGTSEADSEKSNEDEVVENFHERVAKGHDEYTPTVNGLSEILDSEDF